MLGTFEDYSEMVIQVSVLGGYLLRIVAHWRSFPCAIIALNVLCTTWTYHLSALYLCI